MSLIIPQLTCDFYAVQTVLFVSQYWIQALPPKFVVYPQCAQCSYLVNFRATWTTSQEPLSRKYELVNKHLFSFTGSTLTQESSVPIPGEGRSSIPINMEMTGDQSFKLLGRNNKDLGTKRLHSYTVGIKDPMGIVWCYNQTIYNHITRPSTASKVPPPPSTCVTDLKRYSIRDGKLDVPLTRIPVKVGSTATISLMISTRALDIQCTLSLRSDELGKKELPTTTCAFGLITVQLSITTDPEHSVDKHGVPYMIVGGILHYRGVYQIFLINYLYVRVSNVGGSLPESETCKKIESLAFTSTSIGDKSNIPIEDMPLKIMQGQAECTLSLYSGTGTLNGRVSQDPIFLLYIPSATKRPLCKCLPPSRRLRREVNLIQPITCPICSWSRDKRSLDLTFTNLPDHKLVPKDIHLYLLGGNTNRAWRARFLGEQTGKLGPPTGSEILRGGGPSIGAHMRESVTDSQPPSDPTNLDLGDPAPTNGPESHEAVQGDSPGTNETTGSEKPVSPVESTNSEGAPSNNEGEVSTGTSEPGEPSSSDPSATSDNSVGDGDGHGDEPTQSPPDSDTISLEDSPVTEKPTPNSPDSEATSNQTAPASENTPNGDDTADTSQGSESTSSPGPGDQGNPGTNNSTDPSALEATSPATDAKTEPAPDDGSSTVESPLTPIPEDNVTTTESLEPPPPDTSTQTTDSHPVTPEPPGQANPPTPTASPTEPPPAPNTSSLTTPSPPGPTETTPDMNSTQEGKYWAIPLYTMMCLLATIMVINFIVCIVTNAHPNKYA